MMTISKGDQSNEIYENQSSIKSTRCRFEPDVNDYPSDALVHAWTQLLKLHPLMDEFMEEIDSQLDVISERLIALDGSPYSTLKEMAENTKIQDWPGEWDKTTPERLAHLVDGYRYLEDLYQHGIEVSDVEKDFSTQDIFIGLKTAIEKKIWMIQAELGSAPKIDE